MGGHLRSFLQDQIPSSRPIVGGPSVGHRVEDVASTSPVAALRVEELAPTSPAAAPTSAAGAPAPVTVDLTTDPQTPVTVVDLTTTDRPPVSAGRPPIDWDALATETSEERYRWWHKPLTQDRVVLAGVASEAVVRALEDSQTRCPVCITEYMASEVIVVTFCRHIFHFDCISRSMQHGVYNCPMCR